MDVAQDQMDVNQDGSADNEVMDAVGMDDSGDVKDASTENTSNQNSDPLYVQKRLKQQKRAHEREIRELHARISDMQTASQNTSPDQSSSYSAAPDGGGMMDEQIHKAVSYALNHRDMEERKARDAQQAAHVSKQYNELQKHLDNTADKYDDFDDVVRGHDAPFTPHMRDASLLLPKNGPGSAGETLYELGKNRIELKRISELHPLDQASEMVKLSHALMARHGDKTQSQANKPLGNIKSNPVTNTASITDKTPVSELRKRMKANWR